jgi:hypothetical protein
MRVGMAGRVVWSFMMATAHGAGLLLVPFLLPLASGSSHVGHTVGHHMVSESLAGSLAATAVHTLAMLAVTGTIAVVRYDWVGLAFLRRGWIKSRSVVVDGPHRDGASPDGVSRPLAGFGKPPRVLTNRRAAADLAMASSSGMDGGGLTTTMLTGSAIGGRLPRTIALPS